MQFDEYYNFKNYTLKRPGLFMRPKGFIFPAKTIQPAVGGVK